MKSSIILNSRQRELLQTLLDKQGPISYKYLSEYFKLSTRTIQREVKALTSTLKEFDINISRKMGIGIELQGTQSNIAELKGQLKEAQIMSAYSPEERQEGIAYDLLLANDPIKQGYFSTKYEVSVATIAHDLDKVSEWLEDGGVTVDRSPGIGIAINGTEQQRRTLLSRLLHKDITFEDWLELFHEKRAEIDLYGKLGSVIRSRLLKFVQTDKILTVDRVLNEILNGQVKISLNDRSYVNLMIHILLAMERIESGKVIENSNLTQWEPFDPDTLSLAEKIVKRLGQVLTLNFPDIEVKYIALHLAGAKETVKREMTDNTNEEFLWIELTHSFIRSVEFYLEESFEGDQLLFEGLVSHFVPVFNRLKYNLQIHNPMVDKIKLEYPEVFEACQKACAILTEKTGYTIPEDEIGYLAMHIGASILRIEEGMKKTFKAVVVCASGLGTSMYLATKIKSQIPNLQVEEVISVNELERYLKSEQIVDIIVSTVNLPVMTSKKMVIVSPFLKKEDLAKIRNTLINTVHVNEESIMTPKLNESMNEIPSLKSIATYGEGMIQILRSFKLYNGVKVTSDNIASMLRLMKEVESIKNLDILTHDLKQREKLGGFVLGNLAMIHTKSEGVIHPIIAVFRIDQEIIWLGDDEEEHKVQTIILIVVPMGAPVEHMKIISEIPAAFVDEQFVQTLVKETEGKVKSSLEKVLTKAFESRITSLLKGFRER